LLEYAASAEAQTVPTCQDTGMAILFVYRGPPLVLATKVKKSFSYSFSHTLPAAFFPTINRAIATDSFLIYLEDRIPARLRQIVHSRLSTRLPPMQWQDPVCLPSSAIRSHQCVCHFPAASSPPS